LRGNKLRMSRRAEHIFQDPSRGSAHEDVREFGGANASLPDVEAFVVDGICGADRVGHTMCANATARWRTGQGHARLWRLYYGQAQRGRGLSHSKRPRDREALGARDLGAKDLD